MNKDGFMRAIHFLKRLIWILVGLISIIFLLKAYIKMVSEFIVHIVILLAGVVSSFCIYKEAKRIRDYLHTVRHTM